MINLDNASTTKINDVVLNEIALSLKEDYFNMGAKYKQAKAVEKKFNLKKEKLLSLLGANGGDIIVTPSATCANNLCIRSLNPKVKGKMIFGGGEHSSVYECAIQLKNLGANVQFVKLDSDGRVSLEDFKELMDETTCFVSIMHISNETGAINNIKDLAQICKERNPKCLFHSDGVQAFGKIPVSVSELGVDFYTISAHKIGGPKGVGALYAKDASSLKPLILGGGQEMGLVSGTENYAYFAGLVTAGMVKLSSLESDLKQVCEMKNALICEMKNEGIEFSINGGNTCSPYILNVSFAGIRGETLLYALAERGILVANGSACSSKKAGNRTLEAMGKNSKEVLGAVRFSFYPDEKFDAKMVAKIIKEEINNIRQ